MSCFWQGILKALEYHFPKDERTKGLKKVEDVVELFQESNTIRTHVLWNGQELKRSELNQNFDTVHEFDINTIGVGHETSVADPFLLLLAQLFPCKIRFNIQPFKTIVTMEHVEPSGKVLKFCCTKGHFTFRK